MREYDSVAMQVTESGCRAFEGQIFRYIERVTLGFLAMIAVDVMGGVDPGDPIGLLLLRSSLFLLGAGFVMLCVMDLFAFVEAHYTEPACERAPRLTGCRVKAVRRGGGRSGRMSARGCRERRAS